MSETNVICVTSIRNDAWIIENFLECASAWANFIIIGDHNSTDDCANIARQHDCVKVISHRPASGFLERRRDLLNEARKLPGKRLIFALDVDEMISANWSESADWNRMINAQPGTCFATNWIELYPGLKQAASYWMHTAFVDDGSEYPLGEIIHGSRFPDTDGELIKLYDIKLLHYDLLDPGRMFSKHRYYKCYEFIERHKRPWEVSVFYQDTKFKTYGTPVVSVEEKWLKGYKWLDDYRAVKDDEEKSFWFDGEVLDYFDKYGVDKFRKLNIWDVDWNKKAKLLGRNGNYDDPRSGYEAWIHRVIQKYREGLKTKSSVPYRLVRLFARTGLRVLGW